MYQSDLMLLFLLIEGESMRAPSPPAVELFSAPCILKIDAKKYTSLPYSAKKLSLRVELFWVRCREVSRCVATSSM